MLLPTAIIHVKTSSGYYVEARALCDTGAQGCLVTCHFAATKLNMRLSPPLSPMLLRGIGNIPSLPARGCVPLTFKPVHSPYPAFTTSAIAVDNIAGDHPDVELPTSLQYIAGSLSLADTSFYKPNLIEVLLGADVIGSLLRPGLIHLSPGGLTAISTIFGYVVTGPVTNLPSSEPPITCLSLSQIVERFWKIEEVPESTQTNPLHEECETFFKESTTRNHDGTFVTRLPFLSDRPSLGESLSIAERRC